MKEKRRDEGGVRVGEEEENFDPKTIGCSSRHSQCGLWGGAFSVRGGVRGGVRGEG